MGEYGRFPSWFKEVNRQSVRNDLFAGLTGAVVVLPQGVAFAGIAGLPAQYGLYTAMVPAIVAALLGSSRHLISGPTTAISLVVFATLAPLAEPNSPAFISLALTLAFLVGLVQLFLGLARLGAVVNFVSHSVVVGFTCGAVILIITSQVKNLLGVSLPRGGAFLETWVALWHLLPEVNPYAVVVGVTTLLVAIVMDAWFPRWPGFLMAMGVGSGLAAMLGATEHAIALVGSLPDNLPPFSWPSLSLDVVRQLSSGALAIAVLGLIEAVSIARSIAMQSGHRIDGNQEFIGQGVSNVAGSFFSSFPSSGSFTRSGVNYRSGAKTPLSAIFSACWLMLILLLVASLAAYLPIAAMAGVILKVAYNLIDFQYIKTIVRLTKPGMAVMLVTFVSTLFLELEIAIFLGVFLSLSIYLSRTSIPTVVSLMSDPKVPGREWVHDPAMSECPQLKVIRIDGTLFFGSVGYVEDVLRQMRREAPDRRQLLIVGDAIRFMDLAGMEMLIRESKQYRKMGGHFFMLGIQARVCSLFKQSGYIHLIGRDHIFSKKEEAIVSIVAHHVDHDVCRRCPMPVFSACPGRSP